MGEEPKATRQRASRPRSVFPVAKRLAVLQQIANGSTIAAAAKEHDLQASTIYDWIQLYRDEYAEMARAAWHASMARFPEACQKALAQVLENIHKLEAFSAAKVLNELLAAWEKGLALDAAANGPTAGRTGGPPSPLADAVRAVADAIREQRGAS